MMTCSSGACWTRSQPPDTPGRGWRTRRSGWPDPAVGPDHHGAAAL